MEYHAQKLTLETTSPTRPFASNWFNPPAVQSYNLLRRAEGGMLYMGVLHAAKRSSKPQLQHSR